MINIRSFGISTMSLTAGVIPSGAALQAERGISRASWLSWGQTALVSKYKRNPVVAEPAALHARSLAPPVKM
jgi:hypothetical protein